MNPFELRGPQFLIFYVAFGAGLLWLMRLILHRLEAFREVPRLNLTDPYEIAMLRGDANEAMRAAAVSLVDRDMLKVSGDHLTAKEGAEKHVRRPIEKAMLEHFSSRKVAHQMYDSLRLQRSCEEYGRILRKKRLLAGPGENVHRLPIFLGALAAASAVTWIKVDLAIDRGRPFGFLVILTIVLVVLLIRMTAKRRTALGDRVLQDLRTLFQHLKTRAHLLRRGGDTNEVALLVAVFGIPALSSEHDYARLLFPKAASGGDGGSPSGTFGCGSTVSSCGSSSGGCGGGGGGCGGCGGGGD